MCVCTRVYQCVLGCCRCQCSSNYFSPTGPLLQAHGHHCLLVVTSDLAPVVKLLGLFKAQLLPFSPAVFLDLNADGL